MTATAGSPFAVPSLPVEPIPGYRLLERLGQGGFGEVWKAQAPGGLLKAIKIVFGNLNGSGEDEVRVRQELKALERVKSVRHPFILSLERFDIIDSRLLIVMELADRSIHDRFRECQAQRLPGIPRDELLRYLEETAEALDLMNIEYQLQHLDIKPQNLFLVHNHIKVGDFGLVKDLEGMRAFATSGLTPVYAAPETFEGVVTPWCDQYNLAIVYQELLTGQLPFTGISPRHLMMMHLTGQPNLSALPEADRPAIARALAKKPEERHPTCGDLVRALRSGSPHGPVLAPAAPAALPPPPLPGEQAQFTTVHLARKPEAPSASTPTAAPREPAAVSAAVPKVDPPPPERPEVTGDGVLFPAVVVGLGGVALRVLQQLRKALHKRCGPPSSLPHIRLLYLDTDPEAAQQATWSEPDLALREDEVLVTRLQRPSHYLKPGRERQAAERWLNMGLLSRLPRDLVSASGYRVLGRLAFVTNFGAIASRLRAELDACLDPQALVAAERQTGLRLRTNRPRVYVVSGLAGGSGSGMFLDLAYTARHLLRQMGYPSPDIMGLSLLPAVARGMPASPDVQNAVAALTELHHFADPQTTFTADYLDCERTLTDRGPPFRRCVLLPLPPVRQDEKQKNRGSPFESLGSLAAQAADFLGRDLTTELGQTADRARPRWAGPGPGMSYQTFGSFWFAVPRRPLLQRLAQSLCHRLVQDWRDMAGQASSTTFYTWVGEQLGQHELMPERLTARLDAACAQVLGQEPDAALDAMLARWTSGAAELARDPPAAAEALAQMEQLVGLPDHTKEGSSTLAETFRDAAPALGAELDDQLAEIGLRVLSEPRFRLTGAEEAVQQTVRAVLQENLRGQQEAGAALRLEAGQLHETATGLVQGLAKRSFLWGRNKTHMAADLIARLREYPRTRWRCLALEWVCVLYQELLGNLHRHLRDVNCCRPRIAQLLKTFSDQAERRQKIDLGLGRYLLPTGCRTLDEGVDRILGSLTPEEFADLNEQVEAVIRSRFQAQVHVCTAPANFFKDLEEEVNERVAAFAEVQLGRAHAAEVYLEQNTQDEAALEDLAGAFDEAVPELVGGRLTLRDELCILAVPPGPEGEYFRSLVGRALPDQELIAATSTDDIVFYREQPNLSLAALPHLGQAMQEACRQTPSGKGTTSHCRADIADWLPLPRA